MKKIIALVLALVMVLSLSTVAFAAPSDGIQEFFVNVGDTLRFLGGGFGFISNDAKNIRDFLDALDNDGAYAGEELGKKVFGGIGGATAWLVDYFYDEFNPEVLPLGVAYVLMNAIDNILGIASFPNKDAIVGSVERGVFGLAEMGSALIDNTQDGVKFAAGAAAAQVAKLVVLPITRTISNIAHDVYRIGDPIGAMLYGIGDGLGWFFGYKMVG